MYVKMGYFKIYARIQIENRQPWRFAHRQTDSETDKYKLTHTCALLNLE